MLVHFKYNSEKKNMESQLLLTGILNTLHPKVSSATSILLVN